MHRPIHFILPGDPETRTGGYLYDARLIRELRQAGIPVELHCLPDRFPLPDAGALDAAESCLATVPDCAVAVIDGLAYGAMPELAARHGRRISILALVHHPLAVETGLDPGIRSRLFRSERLALSHACRIVTTSRPTADALIRDYGVSPERLDVVPPGTDPAPLTRGSGGGGCAMLAVGTITPRKGHLLLIEALAGLGDLPWTLACVGSLDRSPETARALREAIERHQLSDRVTLTGEIGEEELNAFYGRADLFVSTSFYEGYGMALAEAVARGLPIVETSGGAAAETVPKQAAIMVAPGDEEALRAALRQAVGNAEKRRRLAAGAIAARRELPSWAEAAAVFARAIRAAADGA